MSFQPNYITFNNKGLVANKKPFLLMDNAFQTIENAYVWRERIKKREGLKLAGRLRREFTNENVGNVTINASTTTVFNLFTLLSISETNAELEPGDITTITLAFAAPNSQTWTDSTGTGVMTGNTGTIDSVSINYPTGDVTVVNSGAGLAASALTVSLAYYPNLPVMGIEVQELEDINVETTAFFDTTYVYTYDGDKFNNISDVVWAGNDANFFWGANYRGSEASTRLFFVTNFTGPAADANNRIRYTTDLVTWTDFTPAVSSTQSIFMCKLIIPYYGRLLFLYTYEGTTAGTAAQFFNRCRFSQIGNPIQADAWRSDQFGKGGFIDAPTNEAIVSARFYKNTLIVFFERSTWQLRYVGEYGLPFLWERISSDFGSESTFSTILFDQGVLAIGDKAIVSSSGNDVQRIDVEIPNQVFDFQNEDNGKERIQGERDFRKEVVYWTFVEPNSDGTERKFPNRVLLYNYRNNTWAKFRDNVTTFGTLSTSSGDSWDDEISWDSDTSWDTRYQGELPTIVSGNQQGFVHYYQSIFDPDTELDHEIDLHEHESLYIQNITRSATASLELTVPNHNLEADGHGDIIFITGLNFVDTSTGTALATSLNDKFYIVSSIEDKDTITIKQWDQDLEKYVPTSGNQIGFTPATGTGTYMGGGLIALLPKLNLVSKDFNPYQQNGLQFKSSYTDFLIDGAPFSEVSVNIYANSYLGDLTDSAARPGNTNIIETPIYSSSLVNGYQPTSNITNVTQSNPCTIRSTNHGLLTGDQIIIGYINGMTELNGELFTITYIDEDNFSLDNTDSTAFSAYTYGGNWKKFEESFFYIAGSQYAYVRFYSNVFGQFLTFQITYNDKLMNTYVTHISDFELNAMVLYTKPSGRLIP